jgi:hypothetical protein
MTELLLKSDKALRRVDSKLPCNISHNLGFLLSVSELNGLVYYLHETEVISIETYTYFRHLVPNLNVTRCEIESE